MYINTRSIKHMMEGFIGSAEKREGSFSEGQASAMKCALKWIKEEELREIQQMIDDEKRRVNDEDN